MPSLVGIQNHDIFSKLSEYLQGRSFGIIRMVWSTGPMVKMCNTKFMHFIKYIRSNSHKRSPSETVWPRDLVDGSIRSSLKHKASMLVPFQHCVHGDINICVLFYCQCTNSSIIVRHHDQGASICILLVRITKVMCDFSIQSVSHH